MPIEKLSSSLLADAKKEANAKIRNAEKQVEELLSHAKKEWAEKEREVLKQAEEIIKEERKERIAWARLESKRRIEEAKDEVVKKVMDALAERFKRYKKSTGYESFLKGLVKKAETEMGKRSMVLHVAKGDGRIVRGMGVVKEDLDSLGGVVVESRDGSVRVDYSFETLVEMKKEEIRRIVYAGVFERRRK
ncbi:MAG: V-type ATP synthase subunit E [Candidatus Anstonellales archaeon]